MTKKDRVVAAIAGREVDAVPSCFSMHFPKDRNSGENAVQEHLKFFQQTDTDILKLMNENLVPDMGPIQCPEDWKQVRTLTGVNVDLAGDQRRRCFSRRHAAWHLRLCHPPH